MFVNTNEGNGLPLISGASCAANAVHIVFWNIGKFIIDDVGKLIDI